VSGPADEDALSPSDRAVAARVADLPDIDPPPGWADHAAQRLSGAAVNLCPRDPANLREWLIVVTSSGLDIAGTPVLLSCIEEHDDLSVTLHLLVGPDRWEVLVTPPQTIARRTAP
jgi:hypothetical protein